MDLGGILGAIIIGGIAGWVASLVMKTDASMGILANVLVGVVGALIGDVLLRFVFDSQGTTGFSFRSFLVSLLGALVLLFVVRMFRGSRSA